MNTLLEKLFAEEGGLAALQPIVNEIQAATEADPGAWYPELKAAGEKASQESGDALRVYQAHMQEYEGKEDTEDAIMRAKARAWDLYWEYERAGLVSRLLWEQFSNAGYVLDICSNAGYIPARQTVTTDVTTDEFPF